MSEETQLGSGVGATETSDALAKPADGEEGVEELQELIRATVDEVEGPRQFWKAWDPEVAKYLVDAIKEAVIVKHGGQTALATKQTMINGLIKLVVLILTIGGVIYLSATNSLTAASAGALMTLVGYLMGRQA